MAKIKSVIERFAEACGLELDAWIALKDAQDAYEAAAKERSELACQVLEENGVYVPPGAR